MATGMVEEKDAAGGEKEASVQAQGKAKVSVQKEKDVTAEILQENQEESRKAADNARGHRGVYYEEIDKKIVRGKYNPMACYAYSSLRYGDDVYTSSDSWVWEKQTAEMKKYIRAYLGDRICKVYGNHGLYWSVDKSELHEVTDSADLYTLRGNKKEHRLCIFYQSTFEGERDSPCYVLAIYQRLNGIYLESGEELFQERLCLDEFNLVTEGEKKKKWNQDKIRAFRRKLYRGKFVPDNDELVNEVEIREDTVWFSNDYGECIALSLGKNGEVVFYGGGNRFILQMGK